MAGDRWRFWLFLGLIAVFLPDWVVQSRTTVNVVKDAKGVEDLDAETRHVAVEVFRIRVYEADYKAYVVEKMDNGEIRVTQAQPPALVWILRAALRLIIIGVGVAYYMGSGPARAADGRAAPAGAVVPSTGAEKGLG